MQAVDPSTSADAMERIVFWQPTITTHQANTLEELDRQPGLAVAAYEVQAKETRRADQVWTRPSLTFEAGRLDGLAFYIRAARQVLRERKSAHVFWSPFASLRMLYLLALANALGLRFYLVSEPYSPSDLGYFSGRVRLRDSLKSRLRPQFYRAYAALLCRRMSGVFAISDLASEQYRALGVPSERIFPFGYFVREEGSGEPGPQPDQVPDGSALRCIFVGNLIPRKGLDLLPQAARYVQARGASIRIDVYGPGTPGLDLPGCEQVRLCGPVPFGEASEVIRTYDLLVVPSRHDGWAVVVNEGIQAGTPVVCSSAVGAKTLVTDLDCGWVFRSDDAEDLGRVLLDLALHPEKVAEAARNARQNRHRLHPRKAAKVLGSIIAGRPCLDGVTAPWNAV
ncbi:glycosyltransferase family 4 protein [Rubellimicrobium roseum]|nr:glycosyltransferase family 4 protein [Rubellimicrobium roseum]